MILTSPQLLVVVGMQVTFTCDVFIKPNDVVIPTWSNGSNSIAEEYVKETQYSIIVIQINVINQPLILFLQSNNTALVTTTLSFISTRWHHDTNIKCSAQTNSMIKYSIPAVSAAMRLSVLCIEQSSGFQNGIICCFLDPPLVALSPLKIVIQEGGTAILTCTYDANPGILTSAFW